MSRVTNATRSQEATAIRSQEATTIRKSGERMLFVGDSITDADRDRTITGPDDLYGLGHGYVQLLAARLLADHPRQGLHFFNRGEAGGRVPKLAALWAREALLLEPDTLSLLAGVNDYRYEVFTKDEGQLEAFEESYHGLLDAARRALPGLRLVLLEPFVLPLGVWQDSWEERFGLYRAVVREQARVFDASFVPLHDPLRAACAGAPAGHWGEDGVHPTLAGHQRIADAWLASLPG